MNDIVEKVARAICSSRNDKYNGWENLDSREITQFMSESRAAVLATLEALKEPTEGMVGAGCEAWEKHPMAVVTQFRAMLEAAQKEVG